MTRTLITAIFAVLLSACGDDQPASSAGQAAAPAPAPAAAPAAEPAAMPAATAGDDDAITYDPIDVSKLENQWWQQYSSGG